jgi:NitT/TauT family transport system permease protein
VSGRTVAVLRERVHRSIPLLTFVVGVAAWEGLVRFGVVAPYLLPPPSAVAARLIEAREMLFGHTVVTAIEIVLGFLLAVVVGVALAIAVVYVRAFEAAIYPWVIATQTVPKVALAPLFIVWLGFGLLPKVVIAFLIAFFPILVDTVIGLKSVESESVYLLRSMGAGPWKVFRYVRLPTALPNLFGGMKVAIMLATVGAIVGEFVGSNDGLGYTLLVANGTLDTSLMFSALVLISSLAWVFYMVVSLLEGAAIRWHVSKRTETTPITM